MSFLTAAAQGAQIANSIAATNYAASSARAIGETTAASERYSAAVQANQILIQSENAARAAETSADNEEFNAAVADQLAEAAVDEAGANATDYRRQFFASLSGARATRAASGLALEGSPLMVDRDTFSKIEFGAQRLVHAGSVQANTLRNQSLLLRQQAARDRESSVLARAAGRKSVKNVLGAGDIAGTAARQSGDIKATAARFSGTADTLKGFTNLGATFYRGTLAGGGASWF